MAITGKTLDQSPSGISGIHVLTPASNVMLLYAIGLFRLNVQNLPEHALIAQLRAKRGVSGGLRIILHEAVVFPYPPPQPCRGHVWPARTPL